jgi:hypothetical protein
LTGFVRHGGQGRRGPLVCAPWRAGERRGARRGAVGAWGFNCSSLHGLLTSVLPEVLKYHSERRRNQAGEMREAMETQPKLKEMADRLKFKRAPPKLLCTVVTNFKEKRPKAKPEQPRPEPNVIIATSKWIRTIENIFRADFVPDDVKSMYLPSGKGLLGADEKMVVCLAPTFHQLQQVSQELGIPVTMLSEPALQDIRSDKQYGSGVKQLCGLGRAGAFSAEICKAFISLARYIQAVNLE